MGVHSLWQILSAACVQVDIRDLRGTRVAVDASIWIVSSMAVDGEDSSRRFRKNYFIYLILKKILLLLEHEIVPIFVFDGKPPALKRREVLRRFESRNDPVRFAQIMARSLMNKVLDSKLRPKTSKDGSLDDSLAQFNFLPDLDLQEETGPDFDKQVIEECKKMLKEIGIVSDEAQLRQFKGNSAYQFMESVREELQKQVKAKYQQKFREHLERNPMERGAITHLREAVKQFEVNQNIKRIHSSVKEQLIAGEAAAKGVGMEKTIRFDKFETKYGSRFAGAQGRQFVMMKDEEELDRMRGEMAMAPAKLPDKKPKGKKKDYIGDMMRSMQEAKTAGAVKEGQTKARLMTGDLRQGPALRAQDPEMVVEEPPVEEARPRRHSEFDLDMLMEEESYLQGDPADQKIHHQSDSFLGSWGGAINPASKRNVVSSDSERSGSETKLGSGRGYYSFTGRTANQKMREFHPSRYGHTRTDKEKSRIHGGAVFKTGKVTPILNLNRRSRSGNKNPPEGPTIAPKPVAGVPKQTQERPGEAVQDPQIAFLLSKAGQAAPATFLLRNPRNFGQNDITGASEVRVIDSQNLVVKEEVVELIKSMLDLLGLPFVTAPEEAEAQCAYLEQRNLVQYTITEDSDSLLFGGRRVIRHFGKFLAGENCLEVYDAEELVRQSNLTREKLIMAALLLGCDYCEGVRGVGPVNAAEILQSFSSVDELEGMFKLWGELPDNINANMDQLEAKMTAKQQAYFRAHQNYKKHWIIPENFPDREVVEAFRHPKVQTKLDEGRMMAVEKMKTPGFREFVDKNMQMDQDETDRLVARFERAMEGLRPNRLTNFFKMAKPKGGSNIVSRRLREAVVLAAQEPSEEETKSNPRKPKLKKK